MTWLSQKQKIVALSSCEAEYVALTLAACQGVWLTGLIEELTCLKVKRARTYVDNISSMELAKTEGRQPRSKHIRVRYHCIRSCVEEREIDVQYINTKRQLADILSPLEEKIHGL